MIITRARPNTAVVNRRDFIHMALTSSPLLLAGCTQFRPLQVYTRLLGDDAGGTSQTAVGAESVPKSAVASEAGDFAEVQNPADLAKMSQKELSDLLLKNESVKSEHFSLDFPDDIRLDPENLQRLKRLTEKFRAVQAQIGFGHFNLIGMDEFFAIANKTPRAGALDLEEKKYLEQLFYFEADKYGFKGEKVLSGFTDTVKKQDVVKIPKSGHYLKRGESVELFNRVQKDVGPSLFLTSGVRSLAKQFHLFMEKGLESNGNLSKASRSLAPPGYSFHGRGDFDVGKHGYGYRNFSQDFAKTDEYKRLLDLGYINIRYTQSNLLGVRFEPWHIKVEA